MMIGGKLCRWLPTRGFGFLEPDDGSGDVFLHIKELLRAGIDETQIRVGMRLMFDPALRSGKIYAREVKLAGDAPKPDGFFKELQESPY